MSVEIHLVRHGESVWNAEKRLAGWTDVELTELGRSQAVALTGLLDPDQFTQVWSSDLRRAWHTAELAGFSVHSRTNELREFHFGIHEGDRFDKLPRELVAKFRQFESFEAPDGELGANFYARIDRFLDRLSAGRHLIFAHGGVVRAALRHTTNEQFVANAGITTIDWTARRFIEHVDNPLRQDS